MLCARSAIACLVSVAAIGFLACDGSQKECCCSLPDAAPDAGLLEDAATNEADVPPTPPWPVLLTDFNQLLQALQGGADVRLVLHYSQCILNGSEPGPNAIGGMNMSPWEYFAAGVVYNPQAYVSTSESALVLLQNRHVINYVKVRVYEDGKVNVVAEYLNPTTYAVEMHEEFACEMVNSPDSEKGAWFYRQ